MPAYHSVFLDEPNQQVISNLSLLPLRTRTRGPAQTLPQLDASTSPIDLDASNPSYDIIDESLSLFRCNILFRNFEILGPADRTLIYLTLFIQNLLSSQNFSVKTTRQETTKLFNNTALDSNFSLPGEAGWVFGTGGAGFEAPKNRQESEMLRGYLMQCRQEVAMRLVERLFDGGAAGAATSQGPSKWWLSFSKRKFMGKAL